VTEKSSLYDVVIIGGGIVGCAIARELSRYELKIAVLEKEADVGWGISCRNSGVVHAGFNYTSGTLRAKLCVKGNKTFEKLCQELDVPFKKIGKFVVALKKDELEELKRLKEQGEKNGVEGLKIVDEKELKKAEPHIRGIAALYSPNTAITSPYGLTIALAENAHKNGVRFFLNSEVTAIKKNHSEFEIHTNSKKFQARYLINCAGLYSDKISRLTGAEKYRIYPCRGEYFVLDKNASHLIDHLVYPVPKAGSGGLGVHITPTVDGNILLGPSNEYVKKKDNLAATSKVMKKLIDESRDFLPLISGRDIIRSYAGIRSKQAPSSEGGYWDFVIEESKIVSRFINLVGIESPGLTAAQPIAQKVVQMIHEKESLKPNANFTPFRKGILCFEEQSETMKKNLIREDPDYGEIICRCEKVTKKEILQAIDNPLGAKDLVSIKYRSRAMMGRCQGGYCLTRIIELLREKYDLSPQEITLKGNHSSLLTGYRSDEVEIS